jgi:hypothetical protein
MEAAWPREHSLGPKVKYRQCQYEQKDKDLDESVQAELVVDHRHRQQVEHVHLESQEQKSVDVVVETEANPGVSQRTNSAFVRHADVAALGPRGQKEGRDQGSDGHGSACQEKAVNDQMQPAENHSPIPFLDRRRASGSHPGSFVVMVRVVMLDQPTKKTLLKTNQ